MTAPGPTRCATHPDVETNLRCGKCGKPICPRCLVQTPVGARCQACARLYTLPTFRVSGRYYLKAAAAGLGLAAAFGVAWGFIEDFLPSYLFGLLAAVGIGWAIGEVVSRVTNRKRSRGLAVIAGGAVVLCYGLSFLVDYFVAGFIFFSAYRLLFTLLSLVLGGYFAVNRVR
jgi:hypothetical protein